MICRKQQQEGDKKEKQTEGDVNTRRDIEVMGCQTNESLTLITFATVPSDCIRPPKPKKGEKGEKKGVRPRKNTQSQVVYPQLADKGALQRKRTLP